MPPTLHRAWGCRIFELLSVLKWAFVVQLLLSLSALLSNPTHIFVKELLWTHWLIKSDFGVVVTLLSHECPVRGKLTRVLCLPEASHSAKVERYQFRWAGRTTVVGLVICGACGQYLGLQPMPPSQDCTLVQSLLYFTAKCHWSTETFCQISLLAKFKEVHFIVTSLMLNDEHFIHLFLFFSGSVIKYIKWQIHFSFGLLLWFGY